MAGPFMAGLMSGTSLDGVDVVLVDTQGEQFNLIATHHRPMPRDLKQTLLGLNQPGQPNELEIAAKAALSLSQWYALAVNELLAQHGVSARDVLALGCHGQTVRHQPDQGYTIQLVNGALLAELTGITTITDFRSRDIAAGGQGAPLVPAFHQACFSHPEVKRVILNLGGIANLTRLFPGKPVVGYDCGPANLLLDGWVELHRGTPHDENGVWAAGGQTNHDLLQQLLQHPFFALTPPKSTGREAFNLDWLTSHKEVAALNPQDVQATLVELSARSIAQCVQQEGGCDEVYVCGGGAFNQTLMERIAANLPGIPVMTTERLGISPLWVEACAFAWLAQALLAGRHGNLPAVTGARQGVPLGAIYPAY
jgi:anhydro-N-acetylmuramic acid kinase